MDCNLAQDLITKRVESKIKDKDALSLHKHVLECDDCRDSYLVFDECMDFLTLFEKGETDVTEAPSDFTQSVMAQIGPIYTIERVKESGWVVLKLLWGFSAIILGVTLFLLFNPDVLDNLISRYSALASLLAGMEQAMTFLQSGFNVLTQGFDLSSAGTLSVLALLFVAVMSILLSVLYNSDKSVNY